MHLLNTLWYETTLNEKKDTPPTTDIKIVAIYDGVYNNVYIQSNIKMSKDCRLAGALETFLLLTFFFCFLN